MIGRTLSHYRIEERLGAGGMGEVYRARDEKLGRDVALKVLPSGSLADEEARRRFRKEAAVLSRLSHPHIATLHDFDSADGIDFLVMELVTGPTLEQELRKGPLPEKDVVRLGSQLARGLVAAHEHGVIHRDLKPSNLQLTSDGMLKILDFGVAHLERGGAPTGGEATATETAAGEVLGSPPYMAPEQLLGKAVDARTDLYAAGACLYELATGKRPYGDKRGPQLTEAILHEAPALPRGQEGPVSPGLQAVILKALDKDPELRYQTAKELLVDLERLQVAATSGAASQPVALALAESERRRRRRRVALTVVACLVVAATAGLWLLRSSRPPRITNARPLTGGMDGLATGTGLGDRRHAPLLPGREERPGPRCIQVPATGGEPAPVPIALPVPHNQFICGYLPRESALAHDGLRDGQPGGHAEGRGSLDGSGARGRPVAAREPRGLRGGALARRHDAGSVADGEIVSSSSAATAPSSANGRRSRRRPVRLAWSPDGRRLRFRAAGPDQRRSWVWEVSVDGGEPRALWPGEGGRWTPDGRFYVFGRRDEADGRNDIYAVREPGLLSLSPAQPVRLTFGPLSFTDVGPSPDGKHLFAWGTSDRGELLRYRREGRPLREVPRRRLRLLRGRLSRRAVADLGQLPRRGSLARSLRRQRPAEADRPRLGSLSATLVARREPHRVRGPCAGGEAALDLRGVERRRRAGASRAQPDPVESLGPLLASRRPDDPLLAHRALRCQRNWESIGSTCARVPSRCCRAPSGCNTRSARPGATSWRWGSRRREWQRRRTGPSSSIAGRWERLGFMPIGFPELVARRPVVHRAQRSDSTHRALVAGDRPSRAGGGRE